MLKTLLLAAAAVSVSTAAHAALVVDQAQLENDAGIAGLSGAPAGQTFETSASNIAGGGFFLANTIGTDLSFIIGLWDGSTQLASGGVTLADNEPQWAEAFWTPVMATTGVTYRLTIDLDGATYAGVAGTLSDSYAFGTYFAGDTELAQFDATFRTYTQTAAIPEPSTWALMIGGFGLAGAALRRRPQVSPATA